MGSSWCWCWPASVSRRINSSGDGKCAGLTTNCNAGSASLLRASVLRHHMLRISAGNLSGFHHQTNPWMRNHPGKTQGRRLTFICLRHPPIYSIQTIQMDFTLLSSQETTRKSPAAVMYPGLPLQALPRFTNRYGRRVPYHRNRRPILPNCHRHKCCLKL